MTFPDANWFKTTIPGIIILGAIGSILAVFILKFAYWGLRLLLRTTFRHFVAPLLRSYVLHQYLRHRYARRPDPRDLHAYLIWLAAHTVITTVIFFTLLIATIFYFVLRGPVLSPTLFILVSFTFLSFYCWFSDTMGFTGANQSLLFDLRSARKRLKRPGVTGRLSRKLDNNSPKPDDA